VTFQAWLSRPENAAFAAALRAAEDSAGPTTAGKWLEQQELLALLPLFRIQLTN
jgi:hypothetical protein